MQGNITPNTLAQEIGINPKTLRGWLRANYTRPADVKNTSWIITPDVADAARVKFARQEAKAPTPIDAL